MFAADYYRLQHPNRPNSPPNLSNVHSFTAIYRPDKLRVAGDGLLLALWIVQIEFLVDGPDFFEHLVSHGRVKTVFVLLSATGNFLSWSGFDRCKSSSKHFFVVAFFRSLLGFR